MFNFFFGKATVTEKMLEQNKIKIISKQDLKIERNNVIAVTGSGKFYKGLYGKEAVSIKVVDISKEEMILNEFIYWQEYKNNDCFLKFIGAVISGSEAYLVFEFFAYTLEHALNAKKIKEDNKIKIAKQIIRILETLQRQKKMTRDFRPGVMGITDKMKIKLLDFGFLISDKLINQEIIDKQRNKYVPPEAFLFLVEDISHDIWSFGCILIDIFAKDQQISKQNLSYDELAKLHNNNLFPIIPNDINGLLKDIISKCLERNYTERISITELSENLNILLDTLSNSDAAFGNSKHGFNQSVEKESFSTTNKELQKTHDYIYKLDSTLTHVNNLITGDLMEKTIILKNNVDAGHEQAIKSISENYTTIKELLSEISMFKIEVLDKLKEKIMFNILQMQDYYGIAMSEFNDAQNIITDMKVNVNSLSKLSHPEKYTLVLESLDKNQAILEENLKKYTDQEDYDKILKLYEENKETVDMLKVFMSNKELLLQDILEVVKKHQEAFVKNSNIKQLSDKLKIDSPFLNDETFSNIKTINEIYAKVQENSNIIIVYDIEKKKFFQVINKDRNFNAKSFSFYINENRSIYVSGGMKTLKNKSYEKGFSQVKVKINYDDFLFEFTDLKDMNEARGGHSMIKYEDFLIAVGGLNTKSCEIYSMDKNEWSNLPALPTLCPNPALGIVNKFLFAFSGSGSIETFDSVYTLSLNNLSRIVANEKGFENVLNWEKVDYYFEMGSIGRLRRGMAALPIASSGILLFGGFDFDNIYESVYHFNLNPQKKRVQKETEDINSRLTMKKESISTSSTEYVNVNIQPKNNPGKEDEYVDLEDEDTNAIKVYDTEYLLPIKTFFNSNLLLFDDYLIMIDGYNNAIEFNLRSREFFYYT